jgi:excisionase family DNA binding protein
MEKFLTTTELRELLKLSRKSVDRLLKNPDFPAVKIGGVWRIPYDKLMEYLGLQEC